MASGSSPSERQRFLVGLITEALDDYERGKIGLGRLVTDVDVAINELFDVAENDWAENLRTVWGGLETVYALVLDEGRSTTTEEERGEISESLVDLRSLLAGPPST